MRVIGDDGTEREEEDPPKVLSEPSPDQLAPLQVSLEQRAVWLYSQTGSMARVSRELNIPIYELTKLSRTQFWLSELAAIQREEAAIQNAHMTKILNSTLRQIEDRVENGDTVCVNGFLKTVPVSASSLAKIASVIFDKRQLLRGQPTTIDSADAKIRELADKLRALGAKEVYDQEPPITKDPLLESPDNGPEA